MRKALTRAAHVLAAAGMLGLARPALAQTSMPDTKPAHGSIVRTGAQSVSFDAESVSTGEARLMEMQVEVALLANPGTFGCTLAARHTGEGLELHGFVTNKFVKEQALEIARKHCTVPVIDKLQVNGILEVRIPSASDTELLQGAEALLTEEFGKAADDFDVKVSAPGRLTLHGTCKSCEDLVQISKKLRSLNGCCSVEIHLNVKPLLRAGHMVTLVTSDGSLTVAAPGGPDTPMRPMHVLADSATPVQEPIVAPAPALAITRPQPASIDPTLPTHKEPVPPLASVKPEPAPFIPGPNPDPLSTMAKKPDLPVPLPPVASVKREVPVPVVPAPKPEPVPPVVKKPDLPPPLPVVSAKPEVPAVVVPAPKVEPLPPVVKKPDLPAPLPPLVAVKPEVPAVVVPAPKVEPLPPVVKKPALPATLPPVSPKPEMPGVVVSTLKSEPLPPVVKKPDLPAPLPPVKSDVPQTLTMKADVTPLPAIVQPSPVKPLPPVVDVRQTPTFTPVAASVTTPSAPTVVAATMPPVAAPVGSSASALSNVPAYAKQPTTTGWQTVQTSVEHLPTPTTVAKTTPPPGGWPAAHETHPPTQVAYATTGVVMFDDDAIPEPAPVFAKDKAELLQKKVAAFCGSKASSVRVESTADGKVHVHVKTVAPDQNEVLTNGILTNVVPEMAAPNVKLEVETPK